MYEEFKGTITLVEPLVHMEKQYGVASKFRRMKILVEGEVEEIPYYSGNSIRGILRRLGARHLLLALGIEEKELTVALNHALFRGGMLRRGESATYDTDFICTLRAKLPFLSLLGTAVHQHLVPGKLFVGHAVPIAKETEDLTGVPSDVSVWDMMQMIMFTRRDDRKQKEKRKRRDEQAEQMIYKVEVMIPGVKLHHYFVLNDADEVERACFMRLLAEFSKHSRLGGNARIGFGKVKWSYVVPEGATKPYDDFLAEKREEIREYLLEELNPIA